MNTSECYEYLKSPKTPLAGAPRGYPTEFKRELSALPRFSRH